MWVLASRLLGVYLTSQPSRRKPVDASEAAIVRTNFARLEVGAGLARWNDEITQIRERPVTSLRLDKASIFNLDHARMGAQYNDTMARASARERSAERISAPPPTPPQSSPLSHETELRSNPRTHAGNRRLHRSPPAAQVITSSTNPSHRHASRLTLSSHRPRQQPADIPSTSRRTVDKDYHSADSSQDDGSNEDIGRDENRTIYLKQPSQAKVSLVYCLITTHRLKSLTVEKSELAMPLLQSADI